MIKDKRTPQKRDKEPKDDSIDAIIEEMRRNPSGIRFGDAVKVCDHFFGPPRRKATSHHVYKMPWAGDPRVNIQPHKNGKAKDYQIKQVIKAIDTLQDRKKETGDDL